jgi:antitoxin (DNA-binding transcriptional repressor) of toxin-antitoxin stability system
MIEVAIKDLKYGLSRYLGEVKMGNDVLITEKGKIVAKIIRVDSKREELRRKFEPLIAEGLVVFPEEPAEFEFPAPVELPGKDVSQIVVEDRR